MNFRNRCKKRGTWRGVTGPFPTQPARLMGRSQSHSPTVSFSAIFMDSPISRPLPMPCLSPQVLDVTGGTGAFIWYNGTLTGNGVLNLLARQESTSGSGTLNTTPEPSAISLLPIGLLCLVAYRKVVATKRRKLEEHF